MATFLKAHADTIAAADFFSVEAWTARGPVTHYVLIAIDLATRAVHIAGVTPNPDGAFMAQVARNLTDPVDGFLRGKKYLVTDRDTKPSGTPQDAGGPRTARCIQTRLDRRAAVDCGRATAMPRARPDRARTDEFVR